MPLSGSCHAPENPPLSEPAASCRTPHPARQATLHFDGERLYWQEEGRAAFWTACSGSREVVETKNYRETQHEADTGPIPEGCYRVPQHRLQQRPDDWKTALLGLLKRGTWPGGKKSWGRYRIWLEAESGTETFGRSGFTIHGEATPGSRGCIGLLEHVDEFVQRFQEYGKDMRLLVQYP